MDRVTRRKQSRRRFAECLPNSKALERNLELLPLQSRTCWAFWEGWRSRSLYMKIQPHINNCGSALLALIQPHTALSFRSRLELKSGPIWNERLAREPDSIILSRFIAAGEAGPPFHFCPPSYTCNKGTSLSPASPNCAHKLPDYLQSAHQSRQQSATAINLWCGQQSSKTVSLSGGCNV